MQPVNTPGEEPETALVISEETGPRYLPVKLCALAAFPAIFAVAAFLLWREADVDPSNLTRVSGRVVSFDAPLMGKYKSEGIRLMLEEKTGGESVIYVADQPISPDDAPTLRTLHAGDQVTALVRTYGLPGNSALWEVRRGSETLLSYDQTERSLSGAATEMLVAVVFTTLAALFLVAVGLGVRWLTGSWR